MKKETILLVLAVMLIFSVGVNASNNIEFIGGGFYTTVNSDELNDAVNARNIILNLFKQEIYNQGYLVNVSEMDKLKGAFGFYLGGLLPVNKNLEIGGYYERFEIGSEGNLTVPLRDAEMNINIGLPINGIIGTGRYKLNEFVVINGGVGYYFGEFKESIKFYEGGEEVIVENLVSDSKIDVKGFGFKVGADVDYPINEQMSIIAGANYRQLEITPKDKDKYGDDEVNLDGFEIRGGFSYKF